MLNMKEEFQNIVISIGTDVLMENGKKNYNEKKIREELREYISMQSFNFEFVDKDIEIDFESLRAYFSHNLIKNFKECLLGERAQREQKLDSIIACLCERVQANTTKKKDYVAYIVQSAYQIISYFYETKIISSEDLYLTNKVIDSVNKDMTKQFDNLNSSLAEMSNLHQEKERKVSTSMFNEKVDNVRKIVLNKFIKKKFKNKRNINYEEYADLFRLFVNVIDDNAKEVQINSLFEFVKEKINENESENFIKIIGPDGTGKSTFLSILYMYLYENFVRGEMTNYPFYINLHYYDTAIVDEEGKLKKQDEIRRLIIEDIQPLIDLSRNFVNGILIIIDGNESYVRTTLKTGIILREILCEIEGHKKIICIGAKTSVHTYRKRRDVVYIDEVTKYTFDFNAVCIDDSEKLKNFVNQFYVTLKSNLKPSKVLNYVEKFKLREIDYNLLSIFNECNIKGNLSSVNTISDLYRKYCILYFNGEEEKLDYCMELAYEYFMTRNGINQKTISEHWKEWELIHQHKTISNYFLATYYGKLILNYDISNLNKLECILNNGINVFLKAIINETVENQRTVKKNCEKLYKDGNYLAKAQAVYLLGRLENEDLYNKIKEYLEPIYNELFDEIKRIRFLSKEKMFLFRTASISLLMLGKNDNKGKILLEKLLTNRSLNEINRAFFLQYYSDVNSEPEHVNFEDNGESPIEFTFDVLSNQIDNYINKRGNYQTAKEKYDFQINLFTLCSLVQVRLDKGIEERYVNKLKMIIDKTINSDKVTLSTDMKTYLLMLKDDIDQQNYNIGHIYHELYAAKDVIRSGWEDKIEKGSILVDRFENVVEHMYYTWLLGMLYLPDTVQTDDEEYKYYNKNKILNCILIHDLAETYVGDKRPEQSTIQHIIAENEWMHKIFMHDTYSDIYSMDAYRRVWKGFGIDSSDINGRIAKELDIIQSIYQFYTYLQQGAIFEREKEKEWKREKKRIKTQVGRKILEEVVIRKFENE